VQLPLGTHLNKRAVLRGATNKKEQEMSDKIRVGDFIEIPAWNTCGMVQAIEPAMLGSENAQRVLVQEFPEQSASDWEYYRLEPGEFEIYE
jgi:hypothetical protein